jgi:tRNA threonylcarbamoyladenosine biosynthesis protein TsaB
MSLALSHQSQIWLHESAGGCRASAQIMPQIVDLMACAQCVWSDLNAIAFGAGPGAFTGLRTACSVAQGLALGAAKPVMALDSLLLVAEAARLPAQSVARPLDIWVAMDARMDEIYAAHYLWPLQPQGFNPAWQVLSPPALYSVSALHECWQQEPPQQVAGSALAVFGDRLGWLGAAFEPLPSASRAQALASLAQQAWSQGRYVDAAQALPIYLRNKVAQTTAERFALQHKAAQQP